MLNILRKNKNYARKRREKTIAILDSMGLTHNDGLPFISENKILKSDTEICKRFIASLFFPLLGVRISMIGSIMNRKAKDSLYQSWRNTDFKIIYYQSRKRS